jgi:hypothetical protein
VPLGREKKSGIGRELERVAREIEETLVHWEANLTVPIAERRSRQDGGKY